MENLVLAATGEGFGTCWIGFFNEKEIKEMLKIPSRLEVVALLALAIQERSWISQLSWLT